MRIFHLLKHTLRGSGNACAAVDLACAQADAGHDVYVCHAVGSFEDVLAKHGVSVIGIPVMRRSVAAPAALLQLRRTLASLRPDIVHAHMLMGALHAAALRPLYRYGLVTTVHNDFQRTAILMGLGQRVIGVSEAVSKAMVSRGVPAGRMRTVLNGTINSARRPAPMPEAAGLARPTVVTVCGMHPRKGVADLIEAFSLVLNAVPRAQLCLIGSGPMLEEYKALAARIGRGRVTFMGHMDDPRPVLLGSDIFVLASHAEPAGLAICEAREAGCAIVASDVGGIPEMLDSGRAGVLVPPGNPAGLAVALTALLLDPVRLAEMQYRAQQGLERFTMQRILEQTDCVYRELAFSSAHCGLSLNALT